MLAWEDIAMPVVAEHGFFFNLSHRGSGYSSGPTVTIDHNVIPGFFSVHVGLSRVQATVNGPFGAAVGIMKFGNEDLGPDSANWQTARYGTVESWTVAAQVTKGDMSAWEFFQVWQ
jgi:hypothetical protein